MRKGEDTKKKRDAERRSQGRRACVVFEGELGGRGNGKKRGGLDGCCSRRGLPDDDGMDWRRRAQQQHSLSRQDSASQHRNRAVGPSWVAVCPRPSRLALSGTDWSTTRPTPHQAPTPAHRATTVARSWRAISAPRGEWCGGDGALTCYQGGARVAGKAWRRDGWIWRGRAVADDASPDVWAITGPFRPRLQAQAVGPPSQGRPWNRTWPKQPIHPSPTQRTHSCQQRSSGGGQFENRLRPSGVSSANGNGTNWRVQNRCRLSLLPILSRRPHPRLHYSGQTSQPQTLQAEMRGPDEPMHELVPCRSIHVHSMPRSGWSPAPPA